QLDGGRFATSDLNDLYRRVINRNNRLKRLIDLGAPEIIVNNEKRMLQEAVDALFDNGRRGRPVTGPGNRPLKSLSDLLKGKQGRFRQNLLGKRVDYSGRSVIIVGPQLKLHQCGLPKDMALELFKPFVMKRLVDLNHAQNIKSAKRMVERARPQVWDVLEEVITGHPVLLNRAPTLHRLGIQAFEPQLVEGKAIQLHPLVCEAFNADFDGDQMAVHLPLSAEAQAEARILMLSANNILSPASGRPLAMPRLDMVTGLFHLTRIDESATGAGLAFSSPAEAIMSHDRKALSLHAPVKIRISDRQPNKVDEAKLADNGWEPGQPWLAETTLGRVMFNDLLPPDYPFVNEPMPKKRQAAIVNDLAERYSMTQVAQTLDRLKDAGFYWATRSGVTVSISDVVVPPEKKEILDQYEAKADQVEKRYQRGQLSHAERNNELVKVWTQATEDVAKVMEDHFPEDNPISMIVKSGAAGNMTQVRSLAGMRGLVSNPKGEYIPRPIKANFREGLSVAEYFIATHGARKGLADTALRTADSGYLTRRLVDVSQDVIVREVDCGTSRGINMMIGEDLGGRIVRTQHVETSAYARTLATDVVDAEGHVLLNAGDDLGDPAIEKLIGSSVLKVKVRSVLTCESVVGVCAMCYGRSMATGKLVDVGEAVGIVAAQSIGEPGTQLTMRTFHQGGVAGDDITTGLPRVTELFEARVPKGKAPIADVDGRVRIEESERYWKITLTPDDGGEEIVFDKLSKRQRLANTPTGPLQDGDHVSVGQLLLEGTPDPHEVLRVMGPREAQMHLVDEVQKVYRAQGVSIHDKHIEVIVRQMLRRVTIIDSGSTDFLPGELPERTKFESTNRASVAEGGEPASGRPVLMGITKASLTTDSWLSAASFQETTRVLTDAAINGRSDKLVGLKENVIIGKLIPAGTGINRYRNIQVQPTEEARVAAYAIPSYDDGYYTPDVFGTGTGAAVPLDDYDFGRDFR
ncbi:MAG TPA: DNA-directed RNA polymerase subunit beta', partial [Amycolatopsis sp.]|uniref:DNA-directed RNA polymerase subunit beta' n=1 Tax=Amycolatopsis sp. TaxID=37632 RepID=UPI002B477B13